jgi:hypothetical protein
VKTPTIQYGLITVLALLICGAWRCASGVADGRVPAHSAESLTIRKDSIMPSHWPWRGVSIESRYTRPEEIRYLASVGINFVRIQLKPDKRGLRESGGPKAMFNAELLWTDSILDVIRAEGITAMVAFNNPVLDPNSTIDKTTASFWNSAEAIDSAIKLFTIVMGRFSSRGDELSAYEFMSEPVIRTRSGGKNPPGLQEFYGRILHNLRSCDKTRWLLLSTGPWGKPTNYEGFKPYAFEDQRLIYGAHMYLPDAYTHQGIKDRPLGVTYPGTIDGEAWDIKRLTLNLRDLRNFADKTGYPVFIGEFQSVRWAPNADVWVKDVTSLFEQYGWSWAYFAFGAGQHFWDPFYSHNPAGKEKNLTYTGPETPVWKYMRTLFSKNRKP